MARITAEAVLYQGVLGVYTDDGAETIGEWNCADEDEAAAILRQQGWRRISAWSPDEDSLTARVEEIA